MGMVLSAPLVIIGLGLMAWSLRKGWGAPMSALGDEIRALIGQEGPISLERYMALALTHPTHGYYMKRDPFGAEGDFTTAPEISQMFGELIGLWAAEVWAAMGCPNPLRLIELGPGRGTLMSDALRAARVAPEFRAALDVCLIETSPTLAAIQHDTLLTAGAPVSWAAQLEDAPDGPAIMIANEFLDALPIRQYVRGPRGWRERLVGLDGAGELTFGLAAEPERYIKAQAQEGDVLEVSAIGHRLMFALGARLARQGGAALFIDYGHTATGFGDTLQALRAHRMVDPLGRPRRGRHHRSCRFRRDGAQRPRRRRRRLRTDRSGRFSQRRSASISARRP